MSLVPGSAVLASLAMAPRESSAGCPHVLLTPSVRPTSGTPGPPVCVHQLEGDRSPVLPLMRVAYTFLALH